MYMFVAVPISYVVVDSAPVGNAWILDVGFVISLSVNLLYVSKVIVGLGSNTSLYRIYMQSNLRPLLRLPRPSCVLFSPM